MRGPLILMVYRLLEAINADLPKGFLLSEDKVPQAVSVGLPLKALREAIVNALMHRSYREHRPIQVIRYDNRIEIINPGFSLKSEETLGMPGSETRNPFIAAVFHDTNLAETKGSGIRAMRKLMMQSHLAIPTFESSRENNEFTSRLLLHHFLGEEDLNWLKYFDDFELNDSQKQALLFVREVGAIDNQTYRQMADCDTLRASMGLRNFRIYNLLTIKGKGKATYYVAGRALSAPARDLSARAPSSNLVPLELLDKIKQLNKREHNSEKVEEIILQLCEVYPMTALEIAGYLKKGEKHVKRKYLQNIIGSKKLKYLYPEMINHPEQAYVCSKIGIKSS